MRIPDGESFMTSESVSRFLAADLALAAQTLEAGLAYLLGQCPDYRAVKLASAFETLSNFQATWR
jgi:hypothetical protein